MTNTSNYNLKKYDLNDEVTDTILGLSENMDTLDTELKRLNDKSIVKIVASLPIIGESNALYLVPKADGQTSDIYDEYIWTGSGWEWITTKQLEVDLSNVALKSEIPTQLSQLAEDTTHRVVSDTEKTTWNNKSNFSGSYNDLTNKPTIPTTAAEVGAMPSSTVVTAFWTGTQTQYDAIATKNPTTLYLIAE